MVVDSGDAIVAARETYGPAAAGGRGQIPAPNIGLSVGKALPITAMIRFDPDTESRGGGAARVGGSLQSDRIFRVFVLSCFRDSRRLPPNVVEDVVEVESPRGMLATPRVSRRFPRERRPGQLRENCAERSFWTAGSLIGADVV